MNSKPPPGPMTTIYVKTGESLDVPEDQECYYVLTRSGLFIGRNTPLMRSLVPARRWPSELAEQEPQLDLDHPKVPARLLAEAFGFFHAIAERQGAEAVVLLAWDEARLSMWV